MTDDRARPGRLLLRRIRRGVISTFSTRFDGFPYGSAVPFALDAHGCPILLVSRLAAHTQDLLANPNVSLVAHDDEVVTGARVTLLGRASPVDRDEAAARRYLALFPDAQAYAGFGDFGFQCIEPVAGHYIGGFGDIRWFDGVDYLLAASALDDREDDVVEHMNTDHADTLRDYCDHASGARPDVATMVAIDGDGFDVLADGVPRRFDFSRTVTDADAARVELVRMARESRGG